MSEGQTLIELLAMRPEQEKELMPEHYLLSAVLVRGVLDLLSVKPREARKARKWFNSLEWTPFSYLWVCQSLDLDAARLKRELERIGGFELDRERRPLWLSKRLGAFISGQG